MIIFFLILGLILLVVGAERLVWGASQIAAFAGISPLIIGLTVVAFGTSSPELAVSIQAANSGNANIVIGNVVGSNIFNILLILGISALIFPLKVSFKVIRLEVPIMILASVLLYILGFSGKLSVLSGVILSLGMVSYIGFQIYMGNKEKKHRRDDFSKEYKPYQKKKKTLFFDIFWVVFGLFLLVVGSNFLVESAVSIAKYLGVSDLLIGLTIVAAGTSLPELVTSIVASLKKEHDIAVGNVIGSGIFNILGVLGFSVLFAPQGIDISSTALQFDIPMMIVVSVMCLPIFISGYVVSRKEGILFISYYGFYLGYLILEALNHSWSNIWKTVFLYLFIPITFLCLLISVILAYKKRKNITSFD